MESMPGQARDNGIANTQRGVPRTIITPASPSGPSNQTSPIEPQVTSPPYWVQSHSRTFSSISIESVLPGAIILRDNEEGNDNKNTACWAKGVHIDDPVIVSGSFSGLGAYVVWNIIIETLNGGKICIRRRYSDFDELRDRLLMTFPLSEGALPALPPKSLISKFRPKFLEQRRRGLSYFLHCVLLNPEFSGSPVLKDFLFM